MKYIVLILLLAVISCGITNEVAINVENAVLPAPPNGILVSKNFFVDETEVRNIDYREYLFWTKSVFGESSLKYQLALPDTTVWAKYDESEDATAMSEMYFRDPVFDNFPLVGISYQQAVNYSIWRTDRVAEVILIKKGMLKIKPDQNAEDHFTLNRYAKGEISWIRKKQTVQLPIFRLPTVEEWESIAMKTKYEKVAKEVIEFPLRVDEESERINEILFMIGNVAELTSNKKLKGASWIDSLQNVTIESSIDYQSPTNWIGFRNVSEYKEFSL